MVKQEPGSGFVWVKDLAKIIGVTPTTVSRRAKRLSGIQRRKYKNRLYFPWKDAERIIQTFTGRFVKEAPPNWLSTSEASRRYGIHRDTINSWARYGSVNAVKVKGHWRIEPRSLERRIEEWHGDHKRGWVSLSRIEWKHGIPRRHVLSLARSLNLPLKRFRTRHGLYGFHLRESDIHIIKDVAENYVPVHKYLREEYGMNQGQSERVGKLIRPKLSHVVPWRGNVILAPKDEVDAEVKRVFNKGSS